MKKPEEKKIEYIESRDEMNLAEFPLTLLTRRADPNVKTLTFTDTIMVDGKMRKRSLVITGSDQWGLPTATDEDLLVGLLLLTYENGFADPTLKFTAYKMIQKLGWPDKGQSYQRMKESISRLAGITIYTDGWWDNGKKAYRRTEIFHIIDDVKLAEAGENLADAQRESTFTWSKTMFQSFQANNLKHLDFGLFKSLDNQISKRLMRMLDKRFYKTEQVRFTLYELCYEKLGLSRKLEYRSLLIQALTPAIEELIAVKFLANAEFSDDLVVFHRGPNYQRSASKVEPLIKASTEIRNEKGTAPEEKQEKSDDLAVSLLVQLLQRGVARRWASQYLRTANAEHLAKTIDLIEYFDYIVKTDRRKVKFPGGFLRAMIEQDWTLPTNFRSSQPHKQPLPTTQSTIGTGQAMNLLEADVAYQAWWRAQVDAAIAAKSAAEMAMLVQEVKAEARLKFSKQLQRWTREMCTEFYQQMLAKRIAHELHLMGFEAWLERQSSANAQR